MGQMFEKNLDMLKNETLVFSV